MRNLRSVFLISLLFICGCAEEASDIAVEPEAAPEFELALLDGGQFKLSDHKGSPVVVNFFASWCVPCGEETPVLDSVYQQYRSQGVAFVGVAVNDTETKAREFIAAHGLSFPAGMDDTGEIKDAFGIYGMPTTYFIDRNGMITYLHPGAVTERLLQHEIDAIL